MIRVFGIIGMVIGPIILALLIILLEEYAGLQNVAVVVEEKPFWKKSRKAAKKNI